MKIVLAVLVIVVFVAGCPKSYTSCEYLGKLVAINPISGSAAEYPVGCYRTGVELVFDTGYHYITHVTYNQWYKIGSYYYVDNSGRVFRGEPESSDNQRNKESEGQMHTNESP